MAEAQPTGPNKGHIMVQCLALRSRITGERTHYEAARELERNRRGFDFSWAPTACESQTCYTLAKAALHHGERDAATAYHRRASDAGCRLALD
jgi:hypothetical protein